ncbi:MAG: PD-(D/E)XK nuclease family protein [Alistipes sp.]
MSKGSFFNKIGLADMEKVHSSVIGWMFSDECEALSMENKSDVINVMLNVQEEQSYKRISTQVEVDDIDILFSITTQKGDVFDIIVENKIKSSQHTNQLEKYKQREEKNSGKRNYYVFLTLIGEAAKTTGWKSITYDCFLEAIKKVFILNKENVDSIILNEYLLSVENLVSAKKSFLENHTEYPNVFTDGGKKKQDKRTAGPDEKLYISNNQLETIFQKLFYRTIIKEVQKKESIKLGNLRVNISESHGSADAGFFNGNDNSMRIPAEQEAGFYFDFAFQNGTFKVAISKNYNHSTKKDRDAIEEWKDAFDAIREEYEYDRLNLGKGVKARISITKNIGKDWWRKSKEDIIETWSKEFVQMIEMKDKIIAKKMSGI